MYGSLVRVLEDSAQVEVRLEEGQKYWVPYDRIEFKETKPKLQVDEYGKLKAPAEAKLIESTNIQHQAQGIDSFAFDCCPANSYQSSSHAYSIARPHSASTSHNGTSSYCTRSLKGTTLQSPTYSLWSTTAWSSPGNNVSCPPPPIWPRIHDGHSNTNTRCGM